MPPPPFLLVYLKEGSLNQAQSQRLAEKVEQSGGMARLVHISDGKSHQALCDDLGTESDQAGPILLEFLREITR